MKTTAAFVFLAFTVRYARAVQADSFGSGANTFDVEFVSIGNPDNPVDATGNPNPAGKVEYVYRMGKYEISEDIINKANALGGLGITHNNRGLKKPATSISWFEAAMFVNWLNTSTGHHPAYKFNGSTFELWQSGDAGYNPANPFRNNQAFYVLPTAEEWYKAAYYDPAAGVYYDYPTGSDIAPDGIDFASDTSFDAVFFDAFVNPQPNEVTDVGVLSPYGSAGQGGNAYEWEESELDLLNDFSSSPRGFRGGSWGSSSVSLLATFREGGIPSSESVLIGFRVATIPEPRTVLMGVIAAAGLVARRTIPR
jgi:formylglycine-generating enzyme required for sulfatase activity